VSAAETVNVTTILVFFRVDVFDVWPSAVDACGATCALDMRRTSSSEDNAERRARTRATDAWEYVAPSIVTF
jgi:hypothetical protein